MKRHIRVVYKLPVVLQECTITPAFRDILWTSEVDVHGVTVLLYVCRCEGLRGVITAELNNKRPVSHGCEVAFLTSWSFESVLGSIADSITK
jgi:hypothetical protein